MSINNSLPLSALAGLLLALLLALPSHAAELNASDIKALGITNLQVVNSTTLASGQPSAEQLQDLARAGVKHVVNLRPAAEMDWDEGAVVEAAGMQYHQIPVAGKSGLTSDNAVTLNDVLAQLSGQPTLVHCSSGNRVGSLIAIAAHDIDGFSVDEAVAKGNRWGLTRLEMFVRKKLSGQ